MTPDDLTRLRVPSDARISPDGRRVAFVVTTLDAELFVALKKLRREVVLVRVPDENHELSRSGRPRHRLERFRVILDWFARHLQRPR